ncbi:MAG: preprotein translocase subunit SecD [Methanosarcina thermophila]|jgi:preprotein translocase subunit SecD|uniref:Protein-export membrane protein SecD n=3 Tax=Methanosarcina thermophila TaxID=2210 RepID=A0A0E3NGH0_METTE|nr:preprotein translocase subunit SecD [Methanosarcina thermophila]ALK04956.1 MAG: preprotein translocase subunit SecD [Methanosarcina sp. 795]AKB13679.1 Protein-export membrane protein SecD [Methanosarcina thermophila TM-1]AKB15680.1 Protein-export membrane protein SecD [Methanosarcina thermophila CHTI-55]NLU57602.1 preprotein translocase subunit SecD [Methanosarcina thermophila]SFT63543.1 preprotein translocase subunit SecD [Methanosarcina thermophila]
MSDIKGLFKNVRVIIFTLLLLGSIVAIHPGYTPGEGVTTNLNFGLDLEGGSWLQIKLEGALAQISVDSEELVSGIVEPAIGAPIEITSNNLDMGGSDSAGKSVTFTTSAPVNASQIESLELGTVNVEKLSDTQTQVTISDTSKEVMITNYLSKSLDTEVVPFYTADGTVYEIRTEVSEQQLENLLENIGGSIVKNEDGTSTYKEGVTRETRDLTKEILSDKLNSLGLKDIPVRTVGDEYILIDFAGVDLATAKEIAERPGKFEIRIQTTGNETQHVLYGDSIVSVGIPSFHDGMWHTPFTLNENGARALQKVALETGAIDNPDEHYLNMYLDDVKIYGAPLSPDAAARLREAPIYSWEASTGPDEAAEAEAKALQIHLRAGALPVNVVLVGSGHVDAGLGSQFKTASVIVGIISLIAVAAVVYFRYKRPEILIPMVGTSFSEVIMILGFAAVVGWQLDLASIAGIIAAVGTGIDQLVIITDEVLYEGKLPATRVFVSRIGKAFSIIFGAAATTVIAMAPLVVMGFGTLKGFAITTIIGVLIGVVIARPVYAVVIKEFLNVAESGNGSITE